ncbi:ATP-binding protein [Actinomadura gamaensis]|uniref:ATP-binding protein n=1 Tax=Actinomadura gamaensis TaxID=1763541 RepID=A0ABV9TVZ1_9ACTN
MSLELFPSAEPSEALRWCRAFPGEAAQAAAVRRFVAMLLDGCAVLDDVLLSVDELVVNALRHTKSGRLGGTFTVELRREAGTVAVAVRDQGGPTEPAATEADEFAESGRGLRTVSALAARWGWFGNDRSRTVAAFFDEATAHWPEAA